MLAKKLFKQSVFIIYFSFSILCHVHSFARWTKQIIFIIIGLICFNLFVFWCFHYDRFSTFSTFISNIFYFNFAVLGKCCVRTLFAVFTEFLRYISNILNKFS